MNREIKFRAWDGEEIVDNFMIARPQMADALKILTDEKYAQKRYGLMEWKVMQFTGLLDKNGKEIYEGDIVDVDDGGRLVTVVWFSVRAMFDSNFARLLDVKQDKGFNGLTPNEWYYRCKVVGNIYENPELLK